MAIWTRRELNAIDDLKQPAVPPHSETRHLHRTPLEIKMTQAGDSQCQSFAPEDYYNALLDDTDGDFLFELDSLLQSVGDFNSVEMKPEVSAHGSLDHGCVTVVVALDQVDEALWSGAAAMLASSMGDASPTSGPEPWSADAACSPVKRKPAKTTPSQNRSRKRQRDELLELRARAAELQTQLQALLRSGDDTNQHSPKQMQSYLDESLAWKRVSASEQQLTERGTVENLTLRAIIHENELICKSFSDTCAKVRDVPVPIGIPGFTYADMKKPAVLQDWTIFDSLHWGLDAQYQQLSSILDTHNFTNPSVKAKQRNQFRTDSDGQLFFEHANPQVFPFAASAVSQAFWRLIKCELLALSNGKYKVCRAMGNTLYMTLTDTISLPNSPDSTIRAWVTMKRFSEGDQLVTVWRARMEIQHTCTVRLTDCGWNTTRGFIGANGVAGDLKLAPCILQTHVHSYPDPDCPTSRAEMVAGSLTEKVMLQFHKNMIMLNQKIENILLDEALAIA